MKSMEERKLSNLTYTISFIIFLLIISRFFIQDIVISTLLLIIAHVFLIYEIILFLSFDVIKYCISLYTMIFFKCLQILIINGDVFIISKTFFFSVLVIVYYLIALILTRLEFSKFKELFRISVNYIIITYWISQKTITIMALFISAVSLFWYIIIGVELYIFILSNICQVNSKYSNWFAEVLHTFLLINLRIRKIQMAAINQIVITTIIIAFIWLFIYLYQSIFFSFLINVILNFFLFLNAVYIYLCREPRFFIKFYKKLNRKCFRDLCFFFCYLCKELRKILN